MIASPDKLWDKCLALISGNVSEQQYKAWFQPLAFESFNETTHELVLQVPSPFIYEFLEENYVDLLSKVLRKYYGEGVKLHYRVVVDRENNGVQVIAAQPKEVDLPIPKRSGLNTSPTILDSAAPQEIDSMLNVQQTFSNFIEGDSNKLPRAVGLAIAENPSKNQFNPLFIFGPSGCGKTHLINAIGLRIKQLYPQKRVLYVSARLFQVQFVDARLKNTINDFIHFYQSIDVLIVDDIQEWITATKTQDTFFHIFNHLFRNGKRIILACDRRPVDLKGMNERLVTRFACGLTAELEKPNTQLCIDILNNEIARNGLSIPQDVVSYVAHKANGSVRDLQGVISSLLANSIVFNCKIDMRLAERIISRAVKADDKPLTVDEIVESVGRHYNVEPSDINSRSRKKELVIARQVSMYLARKYTKMPASRIGKLVGGRDHSTVIHSCMQIEQRLTVDDTFLKDITAIERSFKLKNQ